jgi:diamine N-acetyltransferase
MGGGGGCLCGAVRYRVVEIRDAGLCHCASCRRGSGSAFGVWAEATLSLERGSVRVFETRAFCETCGTPLWHDIAGARRLHVGTLDDPGSVEPRVHLAAHEQVPWLRLGDHLQWTESSQAPPADPRRVAGVPLDRSVTRDSPLSLREITADTLRAVLLLDVTGHQRRMVASSAVSLAQLPYAKQAWARAIHAGESVVGFAQVELLHEDIAGLPTSGEPFVWRFMIDARYQGFGLGRRAIDLIAESARPDGGRALWLSCVPGRGSPYGFYRRIGFEDTGKKEEDEVLLRRSYVPA